MSFLKSSRNILALLLVSLSLSLVAVDFAEAKRGFSFGSRGFRTYSAPKATPTAPRTATPQQSTSPRQSVNPGANTLQNTATAPRRGLFGGGFFGSMLGGLALGGLIGMLLGHGMGGFAGFIGLLLQVALIVGGVLLLMRFLGRKGQRPAFAHASGPNSYREAPAQRTSAASSFRIPDIGAGSASHSEPRQPANAFSEGDEIGITGEDLDTFERLLSEVWQAYGREDYAALRSRTTPEIMGFLAEELGSAASRGLINEVRDIRLEQGDLAEAWREAEAEYATVAMRYSSIDVTRERATNRVVEGDPEQASETTELWTFVRRPGDGWRVSAIQQAE
ncbi:TIM44-like domain-containing protein [Stappia sp. F7233]|uniref:TIM44-like domain-containing protein n=1 Tax=Stappia albiluteola TaxID=2758565 RepID=A0A839A840_9HYPH|nr:TIM44-like domain-containing protein [Stappia albiluteola]MBA5775730.1 TIM44-like domain-containing protein [Stappia albiluteola]